MGPNNAMMAASTQSVASDPNAGLGKWYAISAGVSALSQLAGGWSTMRAAQQEAQLQDAQARLRLEEAQRDAAQKAREVTSFQSRQAHRYASSGITLEGTPVLMLEKTRREGQEEVDAIIKRGQAEKDLLMMKSKMLRASGRNSMLGSVLSAGSTGIQAYITGRRLGLFDAPNTPAPATPLPPVWAPNGPLSGGT